MPPTWQVILRDRDGNQTALFDQWLEFTFTRAVNDVGSFGLHLDGDDERIWMLYEDAQVEFWYADIANGIAWYKEAEYFIADRDWYSTADGTHHFVAMGRSYADLLARTINQSKAGSAGSSKSGPAETVIKAYVNEQAGPGAGARARYGLAIDPDLATGNVISLQRSYRNLLEVCQDVARIGGGDFDIVGTNAPIALGERFRFRWYLGQRGTDRTTTVIFSEGFGNMAEPRLEERRSHVKNAALVGAYGEGAGRYTTWRTDAGSIAASPWGRREVFVDAREVNDGNTDAVDDKGDAALAENVETLRFSFIPVQTPGCLYGKAYFLGDLVTARYNDADYLRKVQSVTVTCNRQGHRIDVQTVEVA